MWSQFSTSLWRQSCRPAAVTLAVGLGRIVLVSLLLTGSKSDGQRSPNDAVFLRMDEIPYINEDRKENSGEDGERKLRNLSLFVCHNTHCADSFSVILIVCFKIWI